ncbi:hypothetical protein ARMGADRAFT_1141080 [Armillaria gallica]|uniref:Uncharacterized protein n=1 Tax=Armillaria gallica TaxID=47427 RepID=A0A2H3CVM4_ARMGA|nr:hypothetical protein ARMGADRAFT_1141080 [Armillaria gallica]
MMVLCSLLVPTFSSLRDAEDWLNNWNTLGSVKNDTIQAPPLITTRRKHLPLVNYSFPWKCCDDRMSEGKRISICDHATLDVQHRAQQLIFAWNIKGTSVGLTSIVSDLPCKYLGVMHCLGLCLRNYDTAMIEDSEESGFWFSYAGVPRGVIALSNSHHDRLCAHTHAREGERKSIWARNFATHYLAAADYQLEQPGLDADQIFLEKDTAEGPVRTDTAMTGPGKGGEQEEVAGSIVSFRHNDSSQDLGKRKGCWHGLSGYRDEQGNSETM